jgi:hypothetical protein
MLYAQGPNANGGAREYFSNGLFTTGFRADRLAGRLRFERRTDVHRRPRTASCSRKDLGEDTATSFESIQRFDPDVSWTAVL